MPQRRIGRGLDESFVGGLHGGDGSDGSDGFEEGGFRGSKLVLLLCSMQSCGKNFGPKSVRFSIIPAHQAASRLFYSGCAPATWLQQNNFAGSFVKLMAGI